MRPRRVVHLRTRCTLINGLRVFWVAVVLWCESGAFLWSLSDCRWPDHRLTSLSPSTHILLIADPQILDEHSYPGRPNWLMALTRYIVDFNLRKSWNAVFTKLSPHVVVFLGDMMDNGRANIEDDEYDRYSRRFRSIFHLHTSIPIHYLPGNHDVGLGSFPHYSSRAKDRYERNFGALNQRFEVSNHTFVLLDAPGLVDEDYRRHAGQTGQVIKGGTKEFLQDIAKERPNGPVVLFSHIPLFRSGRSSCGPLRERGTIRPGVGHGYQNLLLRETSAFVLENIRPAVIFSGDDHDYCEYVHTLGDGSKVREVSVKSFSMAMGIQRPGFQLLSLSPTTKSSSAHSPITLADMACHLPNQIKIYTHGYASLAILTVLFLSVFHYRHRRHRVSTKTVSRMDVAVQPDACRWASHLPWSSSTTTIQHQILPSASPSNLTLNNEQPQSQGDEENQLGNTRSMVADSNLAEIGKSISYDLPGPGVRYMSSSNHHRMQSGIGRALNCIIHACQANGSGPRSWYGRAASDLCQVAWLPICVYSTFSIWAFWR